MSHNLDDTLRITRICTWNPKLTQYSAEINEFGKLSIITTQFDLISKDIINPMESSEILYRMAKASTIGCEIVTSEGYERVFDHKTLKCVEN